jgi:transposase InsO family protein
VQYASADYRSALADHGLVASMSRKGNCYDNAAIEAFWSSLKNELVHRRRFATRADAPMLSHHKSLKVSWSGVSM